MPPAFFYSTNCLSLFTYLFLDLSLSSCIACFFVYLLFVCLSIFVVSFVILYYLSSFIHLIFKFCIYHWLWFACIYYLFLFVYDFYLFLLLVFAAVCTHYAFLQLYSFIFYFILILRAGVCVGRERERKRRQTIFFVCNFCIYIQYLYIYILIKEEQVLLREVNDLLNKTINTITSSLCLR